MKTTGDEGAAVLELRDVSKSFGPVVALRAGSLRAEAGSIHALVGENGAGKSTLVKVVAGVYRRDGGEFLLGGEPVDFHSTAESKDAGIAVIYQEPTLFPDLSVTENIFMGRMPVKNKGRIGGQIDRASMHREAGDLFKRLGVHIDPRRPALGLSIADQQIIEIAKAISLDARLLVMDEPTAALSGNEVARLFAVARSLRDEGRALVFISHRFDEVFALCDTVTVMRDGSYISTTRIAETTESQIVAKMVGREVGDLFPKTPAPIGDVVLDVQGLETAGEFHGVSFQVRSGEIVGLAGLVGAGRSEIARAVFGVDAYDGGSVTLLGKPVPPRDPRAAIRAGMAFVPEDRRQQGLVLHGSVGKNIASVIRGGLDKAGFLTAGAEYKAARPWASRLEVKTNALDMHGRHHERRQPAEGRHRQVAGHQPQAADHRRAHPGHRRRHQGRGAPAALRAGRPGPGDPDDLQRAARGARDGRPRARRLRGPDHRRHRARRRHARERDGGCDAIRSRSHEMSRPHETARLRCAPPAHASEGTPE